MPVRMRLILCGLGLGFEKRNTVRIRRERCLHREREIAAVRVKEGGEEREDVGKWERQWL